MKALEDMDDNERLGLLEQTHRDRVGNWEIVHDNAHGDYTERMRVPGAGWIYRTVLTPYAETQSPGVAMVFVPDAREAKTVSEGE